MNKAEIAVMLSFASTLDGRVPYDEAAVHAWALVLEPDIEAKWAGDYVRKHYGTDDSLLTAAVVNNGWRMLKRHRQELAMSGDVELRHGSAALDAHCGRVGCQCAHSGSCFKGWLEPNDLAVPCRMCRTDLAAVLDVIPRPGLRSDADMAAIRLRHRAENDHY